MNATGIADLLNTCNLHGLKLKNGKKGVSLLNEEGQEICLLTYDDKNNLLLAHLPVLFDGEDMHPYKVAADKDTLQAFLDMYFYTAANREEFPAGLSFVANVARLRKGDSLEGIPGARRQKYFIGNSDGREEYMEEIEEVALMNPALDMNPVGLATASKGAVSQFRTILSDSLLGVTRLESAGEVLLYITAEYVPQGKLEKYNADFIKENYGGTPAEVLAADMPADLAVAIGNFQFETLLDQEQLSKMIWEQGGDDAFWNTVCLSALLDNEEFEAKFLPLAEHPDVEVRNLVAIDSLFLRKNENVYKKVKEKGYSDETREWLVGQGMKV